LFGSGWIAGHYLAGWLPSLPGSGLLTRQGIGVWLPLALGWLSPILLILFPVWEGYSRASESHSRYWRDGFDVREGRISVADEVNVVAAEQPIAARVASPYRNPRLYGILVIQFALLAGIAWVGLNAGPAQRFPRSQAWLMITGLLAAFAVVAGRGITGYWRGVLIDNRYKMSLSRLQLLAWTLVVVATIVTAALTNHAYGSGAPLSIAIPPELWVLLGISTASAVASPAVLSTKKGKTPDMEEFDKVAGDLQRDAGVTLDRKRSSVVLYNAGFSDARWGDILKGDESGNASTVDLGKLQMFFFTFVLILGYGAAIVRLLDASAAISALPAVDNSLNTLLGISHTGYLAAKAVPSSSEKRDATEAPPAKKKADQ
jgi:hypothetical protein